MTPAQLIAANLAALPHPDGTARQLPGFATHLMPEHMAQQVTQTANELGEAIIHLLETSGYEVVPAGLVPVPMPESAPEIASVHCSHCDARVLQLNMTNPNRVLTTHHFAIQKCPNA